MPPALGSGEPATLDTQAVTVGRVGQLSATDIGTTVGLREAAQRLGVSTKTAYRYLTSGKLPGARKVDTPSGEAWEIPVASLEAVRARVTRQGKQVPPTQGELQTLTSKVAVLESQLQSVRAIADERAATIETLTNTMRALTVSTESQAATLNQTREALADVQGQMAAMSKQLETERSRKWWQRRKRD
jgi:septal ring factor EnvC (AmiA/AmiB activator)